MMPKKWIMRDENGFLELSQEGKDEFKLYASFGKVSRGERMFFHMFRKDLIQFRDKINDALELTK